MVKLFTSFLALFILVAAPAMAQEKFAVRKGFAFPADGSARILVFRPDIAVGSQSTGGLDEPNAEWTAAARKLLGEALVKADVIRAHQIVFLPEFEGTDGALVADYRRLFKAVTDTVIAHKLFAGNRLPTKKDAFDWSLGPGTQQLGTLGGGDYGLFFYTYDSYGSAGRKAMQLLAGLAFGAYVPSGVHIGYAGLIDLKTGDLVWINADAAMGGDVREVDGAVKRVGQLLAGFPIAAAATVPKVEVLPPVPRTSGQPIEEPIIEAVPASADEATSAAAETSATP